MAIASLDPSLKVIAPVREWKWSQEEEINYAKANGVPIPADLDSSYSVDQNLVVGRLLFFQPADGKGP